ncbi:MAG: hypothetical protein R3B89_00250 [Polyangiaceae bacterium]
MDTLEALRALYSGRRWIVAADNLVSAGQLGEVLRDLGAREVMAIGASRGTGPLASDAVVQLSLGLLPATSMMAGIRESEAILDDLPAAARARVDSFDPEERARVIRAFFSSGQPVAGRASYGVRRPEWRALEDKLLADELWEAAGIQRPAARVVPIQQQALGEAFTALDLGQGCVLAADNRLGWHGGATCTRWARRAEDLEGLAAFFRDRAHQVRLTPFIEGVPCSIHGMVFSDPAKPVAVFRPAEMLVLRRPWSRPSEAEGEFVYASAATVWDPPDARREEMREAARRVGALLRARYGYRGAFTIDGVLDREGFWPTELNPRFGAALMQMEKVLGYPLLLLSFAVIAGDDAALDAAAIEAEVLRSADEQRASGAGLALLGEREGRIGRVILREDAVRFARDGEQPDCTLELGPAPTGARMRLDFDPSALVPGAPLGPVLARTLEFLDSRYGLGLGKLEVYTNDFET